MLDLTIPLTGDNLQLMYHCQFYYGYYVCFHVYIVYLADLPEITAVVLIPHFSSICVLLSQILYRNSPYLLKHRFVVILISFIFSRFLCIALNLRVLVYFPDNLTNLINSSCGKYLYFCLHSLILCIAVVLILTNFCLVV